MKKVLTEIQDGTFANACLNEHQSGRPNFNKRRELESNLLVEEVGKDLREKIRWSEKNAK